MAERRIETRRIDEYPSNSKMTPKPKEAVPKKIVSAPVKVKKKSFGKRLVESFVTTDISSVRDEIVEDVVIPYIKSAIWDSMDSALAMIFGTGSKANRASTSGYSKDRVSYSSYSRYSRDPVQVTKAKAQPGGSMTVDPIVVQSRDEAFDIVNSMGDQIEQYGYVAVSDFMDWTGRVPSYTDYDYGWTDMRGNTVRPYQGGYLVELAPAHYLK